MSVQGSPGPRGLDPGAMFAYLTEWAAKFHDDSSPAPVTDVLVAFAFLVGVNLGTANAGVSAAFLRRMEKEMPAASGQARQLARAMLDSPSASQGEPRTGRAELSPYTG